MCVCFRMGVDRQGVERGKCMHHECTCAEYTNDGVGLRCDYCQHVPTEHDDDSQTKTKRMRLTECFESLPPQVMRKYFN